MQSSGKHTRNDAPAGPSKTSGGYRASQSSGGRVKGEHGTAKHGTTKTTASDNGIGHDAANTNRVLVNASERGGSAAHASGKHDNPDSRSYLTFASGATVGYKKRKPIHIVAIAVATVLLIVLTFLLVRITGFVGGSGGSRVETGESTTTLAASDEAATEEDIAASTTAAAATETQTALTLTTALMDSIPESEELGAFSLGDVSATSLSDEAGAAIQQAIDDLSEQGSVGFVVFNASTGKGIAYNADEQIYGASSFKAPYALYICETHPDDVEIAEVEQPSEQSVDSIDFGGDISAGYGGMVFGGSSYANSLIESAIVNSDNDSFATLREVYDFDGYDEWATEIGATDALYTPDSYFPWYSARSSAKLWTEMKNYFDGGTTTANWLSSLCGSTSLSFLRDTLEPLGATVRNKAGWCAGSDWGYDFNSVSDAGIVEIDGQTYIACFLSGAPTCEANHELLENLISTVFDQRELLS